MKKSILCLLLLSSLISTAQTRLGSGIGYSAETLSITSPDFTFSPFITLFAVSRIEQSDFHFRYGLTARSADAGTWLGADLSAGWGKVTDSSTPYFRAGFRPSTLLRKRNSETPAINDAPLYIAGGYMTGRFFLEAAVGRGLQKPRTMMAEISAGVVF